MYLSAIKIDNYRNLDGIKVHFDEAINFIVGENNLGKTNFLELLNSILNRSSFSESDFFDCDKPISIDISFWLPDDEIGYFGDLFDPQNRNLINVSVSQETPEDPIRFCHQETGTYISPSQIRGSNYIRYDSLRNPINELNFEKNRGVGKFLNYLSKRFFKQKELDHIDFIDASKLVDLLKYINSSLGLIKPFKDFGIAATLEDDAEDLIAKLIVLRDSNNYSLKAVGFGVQFLVLFPLLIFEKLIVSGKKLSPSIFKSEHGSHISIILGLDEPEIHLHPYMQRSLVKYLSRIITSNDVEFQGLFKYVFDIDKINGQLIMATHSPNILFNDFSQIVRFYKDKSGALQVVSGANILLDAQAKKHLHRNFPFVKEAFFSRCVILVEGDTEKGALPGFASAIKINGVSVDLDELGISIVQADGANSIPPIMKMLGMFGIKSVGVIDNDKYQSETKKFEGIPDLFVTSQLDFEGEIVQHIKETDRSKSLYKVLEDHDSQGLKRCMFQNPVNNARIRYGLNIPENVMIVAEQIQDWDNFSGFFLSWLSVNKSISIGITLGTLLLEDDIPAVYKNAIARAVELAI